MPDMTSLSPSRSAPRKAKLAERKGDQIRLLQTDLAQAQRRADQLEQAIRHHFDQVVKHDNWGADVELWWTLKLRRPQERAA